MLTKITIENYKSVEQLELELGRVNVFIGANGCGKSNILEAIAFGSAASKNQLEDIFLATRGIRTTNPLMMKSAFEAESLAKDIVIKMDFEGGKYDFFIEYKENLKRWFPKRNEDTPYVNAFVNINANTFVNIDADLAALQTTIDEKLQQEGDSIENAMQDPGFLSFMQNIFANAVKDNVFFKNHPEIKSFLLYSPENYFLRNNAEEEYIKPLGTRGQGLLNCLKELYKNKEKFEQIQEALSLFDWFESIDIGTDRIFGGGEITIKDRFLHDEAPIFDQRSANEGFLYLLFYAALFVSDDTPAFFAIDNIDNGMNPRMCAKLIEVLSDLAEKNGKQVIFTTHNPAILDGLDLSDENQRLFVISRNGKGRTKAKRVRLKKPREGKIPARLSQLFLEGVLGGLPENF